MGSVLRQGTFKFVDADEMRMGREMQFSGNDVKRSHRTAKNKEISPAEQHVGESNSGKRVDAKHKDDPGSHVSVGESLRNEIQKSGKKSTQIASKATAKDLMAMLQLQQFRCALTGDQLKPESARVDHIVPVSEGGSNDKQNLQWLTHQVNRAKGTMSQDEFITMCIKVAKWTQRNT